MHVNCAELEAKIQPESGVPRFATHRGLVAGLFISPERLRPMISLPEVTAIAGGGLEGDRYYLGAGTFSKGLATNQITLVEAEALEAAKRDYDLEVPAEESRRNVLTCGIALNHLVGQEFNIGAARLRGLKLCEPCPHLEKVTGKRLMEALRHRGGLRAEILIGGAIRVGDEIRS
jgi:MOSC domain-containing protein YiiM